MKRVVGWPVTGKVAVGVIAEPPELTTRSEGA